MRDPSPFGRLDNEQNLEPFSQPEEDDEHPDPGTKAIPEVIGDPVDEVLDEPEEAVHPG